MLVHLVADYGVADLAFAEVRQRLVHHLPGAEVVAVPVPAFDTVSAGFCIAQLALSDGPTERVVFHNVAPRADADDPRPGNEGERLVAGWLPSGVLVVGVDAGHALSFLREEIDRLYEVAIPASGSQFRSRDVFPALVAALATGDTTPLGPALSANAVPQVPERSVVYVDGYGNIKTSWSQPPAELGARVQVRIGAVTVPATVSDGTFAVPAGTTSFAPGSSGWRCRDGSERRFFELLTRGADTAELFGRPAAGARVDVLGR